MKNKMATIPKSLTLWIKDCLFCPFYMSVSVLTLFRSSLIFQQYSVHYSFQCMSLSLLLHLFLNILIFYDAIINEIFLISFSVAHC